MLDTPDAARFLKSVVESVALSRAKIAWAMPQTTRVGAESHSVGWLTGHVRRLTCLRPTALAAQDVTAEPGPAWATQARSADAIRQ